MVPVTATTQQSTEDHNMKTECKMHGPIDHLEEIARIQETLNGQEDINVAELTQMLTKILDFQDLSIQENVIIGRLISQITKRIVEVQSN